MEYQINQSNNEKNKQNYITKNNITDKLQKEENKNYSQNIKNNVILKNINLNNNNNKYINNIPFTSRNNKFLNYLKGNKINHKFNNINDNKTIFQNYNFNNTLLNKNIQNSRDKDNSKTLDRSSSVSNILNNKIKKINVFKGLHRNNSTIDILNKKTLAILPLIKPRKIIIDYCCGPYELHVTNINKKNLNFKKFGHNTFFMGENYNPDNYEIKQKNRFNRNYYGKLFAN